MGEVVVAVQALAAEEESSDMYKDFADIYDLLMWDYDYEKWSAYYMEIFSKYSIEKTSLLELGAGTGSMTAYLSRNFKEIVAIDPSSSMLTLAREKLFNTRNVRFLLKDIREFEIEKKFNACLAACDVMNYMLTEDDFILTLKNVKASLKEGGLFIFDMSSYYKLAELLGNNSFIHDTEDIYYVFQGEFKNEIEDIDLNVFIKDGESYNRYTEVQRMRAYKKEEVIDMMEEVGFKEAQAFHPFTFESSNENDERIMYLGIF